MNDNLVRTMKQGWSDDYGCASVILTAPVDPDKVVTYAHSIGAVYELATFKEDPPNLIIDFQYLDADAGPHAYAEAAVRNQLERDLAAAASAVE